MPANEMKKIGLRERKKDLIRHAIVESSRLLFGSRAFQEVTVAEIADQANVSVKTLFTYFDSKDDLLFTEETTFCKEIISSLSARSSDESYFDSMQSLLWTFIHKMNTDSILESFPGFHKCMDFPELKSRLGRLWDRYEDEMAGFIRKEMDQDSLDPEPRLVAGQLVLIFRMLTSNELKIQLENIPQAMRQRALEKWLTQSLSLVGSGVKHFGKKG